MKKLAPSVLTVAAVVVFGAGATAQVKRAPPVAAATSKLARAIPRIGDGVIAALQKEANNAYPQKFLGLSDYADKRQKLYISSGRTLIAWKMSEANESGGRHRPKPSDRQDLVYVNCGDSDFGEVFNCSKVVVLAWQAVLGCGA